MAAEGTPGALDPAAAASGGDGLPATPIDSVQQFYDWFAELEARADAEEGAAFRSYGALLRAYSAQLTEVRGGRARAGRGRRALAAHPGGGGN